MPRIFVLTSDSQAFAAPLQDLADTTFARYNLRHPWWNPTEWIAVHRAIRSFAPDVLHCAGLQALRVAAVLNRKHIPFAYSNVALETMDLLTRRFAAKGTALVSTASEQDRMIRAGLRAEHIPIGVADSPMEREAESQVILFGGQLEEASDPRQAVWAFDCLKYALPGAQLVFFGNGPMKAEIRSLSFGLGFDDYRVRFAPESERPAWSRRAGVVWLTHPSGGATQALVVLAHGLPILGMHTPELAEYASEGLTLVPAGERIGLASATLKLLSGPRPLVPMPRFPFRVMVEKYAAVYDAMAGSAA